MCKEYFVYFDGINDYEEGYICAEDYNDLINQVTSCLLTLDGGHADIYDEDGEFVEDVEI